jgi:HEAT repeat protein
MNRPLVLSALGALVLGAWALAGCESKQERREKNVVSQYEDRLKAGSEDARVQAARELGNASKGMTEDAVDKAVDVLGDALHDSSKAVRKAAAESLGKIRTTDAMKELRDGFNELRNRGVEGADEVQEEYTDALDELKSEARRGVQQARDTLKALNESWEESGGGIRIDVDA